MTLRGPKDHQKPPRLPASTQSRAEPMSLDVSHIHPTYLWGLLRSPLPCAGRTCQQHKPV